MKSLRWFLGVLLTLGFSLMRLRSGAIDRGTTRGQTRISVMVPRRGRIPALKCLSGAGSRAKSHRRCRLSRMSSALDRVSKGCARPQTARRTVSLRAQGSSAKPAASIGMDGARFACMCLPLGCSALMTQERARMSLSGQGEQMLRAAGLIFAVLIATACAPRTRADAVEALGQAEQVAGAPADYAPARCSRAEDCAADSECEVAACVRGTCYRTPRSVGTVCLGGSCDGFGECTLSLTGCARDADCGADSECSRNLCLAGLCAQLVSVPTARCSNGTCDTAGQCIPVAAECTSDDDCDDLNWCTRDACVHGSCDAIRRPAGTPCPDGVCGPLGECIAVPVCDVGRCDDGNDCTVDICVTAAGCRYGLVPAGTDCSFGVCDELGNCVAARRVIP